MFRYIGVCIAAAAGIAAAATTVPAPSCVAGAAPSQSTLSIQTANLTVPNTPFGLVYASNDIAFAAIYDKVGVLNTTTFTPTLIREYALPTPWYQSTPIGGIAITHDKKDVYLSTGIGAVVVDVEKAVAGDADPFIGFLNGTVGTTALEVTLAVDGYAYVSQEYGSKATSDLGAVEVFETRRVNGSILSTYVGYIALNYSVVGTALSPNEARLYATSEVNGQGGQNPGTLSVLDVETLKRDPGNALVSVVDAGCQPVRVAVRDDAPYVFVTARGSNMLLIFDSEKLVSEPADALLATVQVGTSPVGVAIVKNGEYVITADSNRFGTSGATTGLTVVDTKAALEGKQNFSRIPTGLFPRELAVSPDRKTLLVSDFDSNIIQAVNLSQLPPA